MTIRPTSRRSQPPLALFVPLSRFTSRVDGGSAFYVRPSMCVLLESIEKEPESGRVRLMIRVGDESAKMFRAQLHDPNSCSTDHELFMRLSDLAVKRYCNCAIYQFELMGIIKAFLSEEILPPFPIELGTTAFGLRRPSEVKVFFDRMRRPFYIMWSWWKSRHIRRENLLKYGKATNEKS